MSFFIGENKFEDTKFMAFEVLMVVNTLAQGSFRLWLLSVVRLRSLTKAEVRSMNLETLNVNSYN
jgi:hypothetical protein